MTLAQMLERTAQRFPRRVAIHFEKIKITYRELNAAVNRMAFILQDQLGLRSGEKVCLFAQNSPEFAVAFFAIIKNSAVVVPVNTFFKSEELVHLLRDSGSRLLLVTPGLLPVAEPAQKEMPSPPKIVALTPGLPEFQKAPDSNPPSAGNPEELAVLIYTSGTTGKPKGAMLSHRNLISNIEGCLQVIDFDHRDRIIVVLPMFHSFTMTVTVLLPVYCGARILLHGTVKNFKKVLKSFFIDRATLFAAIPQVYDAMAQKKLPWILKKLLALRYCISGAAALSEATLKKFESSWGVPLIEGYGLSEASPVVSINPPRGVRKALSVGLPLPHVEIKIVDDRGQTLGVNQEGEVCVKGPNVMQGYYQQEAATREVLKEGWLHTGDIGKIDSDGYLFLLDRKKDLIIVRGMNLYPREVEEVLLRHPAIKEVAVIGKLDEKRGEIPVAHLVLKVGAHATERELREYCRPHLADFKIPHQFLFRDALPKTSTGKILKRALR